MYLRLCLFLLADDYVYKQLYDLNYAFIEICVYHKPNSITG